MKNTKTKTYKVTPINSVEDVRSDYSWVYSNITENTVPLEKETGEREVRIMKYDKAMTTEEILADMKEKGLKPASPNALLGFYKQYPDVLEKYQWLVAASSVFRDEGGGRCFLDVGRRGDGRGLRLVSVGGDWFAGFDWLFLAEPLEPSETKPSALGLSDPLSEAIATVKKAGYVIYKQI